MMMFSLTLHRGSNGNGSFVAGVKPTARRAAAISPRLAAGNIFGRRMSVVGLLFALNIMTTVMEAVVEAQICLIVYQVADNGLEAHMQKDYEQLSRSPLVSRAESVRTWIYHDAGVDNGLVGGLPNTLDRSGNALISNQPKHTGSQYVWYNPSLKQFQVETTLVEEVNSLSVEVIQTFLEHALADCIQGGFDQEIMAIFSSHAGGFIGFGEDRHPYAPPLTNKGIATAIENALQNTQGAPPKLEVLGFDACNMQAFGAVDDYVNVTNYFLASEAEEPGHGWHYDSLDQSLSTVDLSRQIVQDFLWHTEGPTHATPKTLAIVETSKYQPFVDAFEILCDDLLSAMTTTNNGIGGNPGGGDVSLHAFVSRARQSAIAFPGPMNVLGSPNPTCLDIGSFLHQLSILCNPIGDVAISLQRAQDAYNSMFVERGNGPGTSPGTGMHILWPTQGDYNIPKMKVEYDQALFENDNYIATNAPNFRALLEWLLHSSIPDHVVQEEEPGSSVCSTGAMPSSVESSMQQGDEANNDDNSSGEEGALILEDTMRIDAITSTIQIDAVISPAVTHMLVEYSISFSPSLKPVLMKRGLQPNEGDYLMLKGGEVTGSYEGSTFASTWDQSLYFLNTTRTETSESSGTSTSTTTTSSSLEALYVKDEGDTKWVPVIYFPKNMSDTVSNFQLQDHLHFDFDYYIKGGGGAKYAYLVFSKSSETGEINHRNLALYISHGNVFYEQPRESGGFLLPLIVVDGYLQGKKVDQLVGGFNQSAIEWGNSFKYEIVQTTASEVTTLIPFADEVVVNLYAYNAGNPSRNPDVRRYGVVDNTRGAALPMSDPDFKSSYLRGEPAEEETMRFAAAPSYHESSAINAFRWGLHLMGALAAAVIHNL